MTTIYLANGHTLSIDKPRFTDHGIQYVTDTTTVLIPWHRIKLVETDNAA